MRSNVEGTRLANNLLMEKNRLGMIQLTSTGSQLTLDSDMPPLIFLKLTVGATNVRLPAVSTNEKGLRFKIINNSTAAIKGTLKTSTGGAILGDGHAATVLTKDVGCEVISDGVTWRSMGGASS